MKDALAKYNPEVIRYTMISKNYSADIDLNDKEFALSEQHLYYFYNTINNINKFLEKNTERKEVANEMADSIEAKFVEAMNDDFNTPVVIANLFAVCKYVNSLLKDGKVAIDEKAFVLNKIKEELFRLYGIIGLFKEENEKLISDLKGKYIDKLGLTVSEIEEAIAKRAEAKAEKNYEVADGIRSELDAKGIILNDSKDGTSWDIKELYNLV